LTGWALWAWVRGNLFKNRPFLWIIVYTVLAPVAANQLGWVAAEVGRQPWIVYGLLRTSDALSPVVRANQVLGSILMFGVIYALLFAVWFVVMDHKIKQGPEESPAFPHAGGHGFIQTAGESRSGGSLTEGKD
jgi:cytochrome d ubiquinol oxidase subunit I